MRLWHYKLIPYLPKSQLVAQWRELNSIYKKQDKHLLINYIYDYDKGNLLAYSKMVIEEMVKRGYKINNWDNYTNYFHDLVLKCNNVHPFYKHHNDNYLIQCFYNLQEKFDRGQKDFTREQYDDLEDFIKEEFE